MQRIWEFIALTNAYFHNHEPWKLAKTNPMLFQEIIAATGYSIRCIGVLLWPVMPKKMEQLLASLDYQLPLKASMHDLFEQIAWTDEIKIKKLKHYFKNMKSLWKIKTINRLCHPRL